MLELILLLSTGLAGAATVGLTGISGDDSDEAGDASGEGMDPADGFLRDEPDGGLNTDSFLTLLASIAELVDDETTQEVTSSEVETYVPGTDAGTLTPDPEPGTLAPLDTDITDTTEPGMTGTTAPTVVDPVGAGGADTTSVDPAPTTTDPAGGDTTAVDPTDSTTGADGADTTAADPAPTTADPDAAASADGGSAIIDPLDTTTTASVASEATMSTPLAAAELPGSIDPSDTGESTPKADVATSEGTPADSPADNPENGDATTTAEDATAEDGDTMVTAPVAEPTSDASTDSPETDDTPEIIDDFAPGEEELALVLPEGMSDAAEVSIEPAGEQGVDAAIVVSEGEESLTAAIIAGAFGKMSAQDVLLMRDG